MASPIWCGNTLDQGWQALTNFCPQMATLSSVLAIGLKNTWRLSGTSASWQQCQSYLWVQTSDLDQSGQCHCMWTLECLLYGLRFLIFMFKISMMLSQNIVVVSAIFDTEHICPSLMCCEIRCHGISNGVVSLANALNKRGSYLVISYLVIDQTAAACRGLGSNSESKPFAEFNKTASRSSSIFLCPLFLFPSSWVLE